MSQNILFKKYHGAGNDFIFISERDLKKWKNIKELKESSIQLCHRQNGVGADGIVFYKISQSKKHGSVVSVLIVNSDGSFAATCGNALRCLGFLLMQEKCWTGKKQLKVSRLIPHFKKSAALQSDENFIFNSEVFSHLLKASRRKGQKHFCEVSVSMGKTHSVDLTPLADQALERFGIQSLTPIYVELANPHWVFISSAFSNFQEKDFIEFGKYAQQSLPKTIQNSSLSVPVANIGMLTASEEKTNLLNLTVFERGAGLTACCGSGATAARVALEKINMAPKKSSFFKMPGGIVEISSKNSDGQHEWILTGPAVHVYNGSFSRKK